LVRIRKYLKYSQRREIYFINQNNKLNHYYYKFSYFDQVLIYVYSVLSYLFIYLNRELNRVCKIKQQVFTITYLQQFNKTQKPENQNFKLIWIPISRQVHNKTRTR